MKVRLRVTSGSSAGKEIKVKEGNFLIGRDNSCQLRARSDSVSRRHCALIVKNGEVWLRDLKSRNGTFHNGALLKNEKRQVETGDKIVVGPLEFELLVDQALGGDKQAPVKSVSEAAARAGAKPTRGPQDDDIYSWLEEGDEVDREQRMFDPETRQFKLDSEETQAIESAAAETEEKKPEKKEPGKLPTRVEETPENSQEAARDALRKFFKRD